MFSPQAISCLTDHTGILAFDEDVALKNVPITFIQNQKLKLSVCSKKVFAQKSGYYIEKTNIIFYLHESHSPRDLDENEKYFFVCGEFNNWQKNIDFALRWNAKEHAWILKVSRKQLPQQPFPFKFVTALNRWLEPSSKFINIVTDPWGNKNLLLDFKKTS